MDNYFAREAEIMNIVYDLLFIYCVWHALAIVHCYLVVTHWERAELLALVCNV